MVHPPKKSGQKSENTDIGFGIRTKVFWGRQVWLRCWYDWARINPGLSKCQANKKHSSSFSSPPYHPLFRFLLSLLSLVSSSHLCVFLFTVAVASSPGNEEDRAQWSSHNTDQETGGTSARVIVRNNNHDDDDDSYNILVFRID